MVATSRQPGFALVTTLLIMSLLVLLVLYLASFTLSEFRIANSHAIALQTYYLAESGVAEAIWLIKNDPNWSDDFETDANWSITTTRESALYPNGSYEIEINNSGLARGEIIVTGMIDIGPVTAQRVVKTTVYKATGGSVVEDNVEYSDGNIDMSGTVLNIYGGSAYSNNNIITNFWSVINVDNEVRALGNVLSNWTSTINATAIRAQNYPPLPTSTIAMPSVSFDAPGDSESYKSRADHIYTQKQFRDLMWANSNLTLNDEITYVTGDIEIYGPQTLTINGVLVSDGNIIVGKSTNNCCWGSRCTPTSATVSVNQPTTTTPAGLIAKGRIDFESCLGDFDSVGLVYGNDKINVLSLPNAIDVEGGLISRKLTMTSLWQGVNITLNNDVLIAGLGEAIFSPVVNVDHWEEQY